MITEFIARAVGLQVVNMGPLTGDAPTEAIAFRVGCGVLPNGELNLYYSGVYRFTISASNTIDNYLMSLAIDPDGVPWTTPTEPEPAKGKSNLSVRHNQRSHLVFVLENMNWQFTEVEQQPPFKVKDGFAGYYMAAKCAWLEDPILKKAKVGPYPDANARCRVASFIADTAGHLGLPTPVDHVPFNINLDLRLRRADQKIRLLPIIIDPDVGYPGGHS